MVKPDIKQNYYADLELPASASIDDIRKAYRKLALQYHPDRNASKEAECIPKFQAIQAAHEVLSDSTLKAKYDQDRRKAGLFPASRPAFNTPGNQYSTTSNYPPPPRRTPHTGGAWQRPNPTTNTAPSGADRFTNFPRPTTTPRKEPPAESTQRSRAWQRMNNSAERPRGFGGGATSPQPPPNTGRQRPQRQDTKLPSEEEIRAGTNYYKAPGYDHEQAEKKKSAWQAFQQMGPETPGVRRSNTVRTPRKPGGFDPSAPGSDERPAPDAGSRYAHRHRSEDLGVPVNGPSFPPPPPGPPPASPNPRRPSVDPFRATNHSISDDSDNEHIPYYARESRTSAPYSAFSGEKTKVSSEGLRRSASSRDATKLNVDGNNASRARSNSPFSRQTPRDERERPSEGASNFANSAYTSARQESQQAASHNADATKQDPDRPDLDQPAADRPKKTPVSRSRRFNSSNSQPTQADLNGNQNMYVPPHFLDHHSFCKHDGDCTANTPSPRSTPGQQQRIPKMPPWAIPSSICPSSVRSPSGQGNTKSAASKSFVHGTTCKIWSEEEQAAFAHFRDEIAATVGATVVVDGDEFLRLVHNARHGFLPDPAMLKSCLLRTLMLHPSICSDSPKEQTDAEHSFSFPIYPDTFRSNTGKSRSEENISTNFSSGWNGTFTGAPENPASGRKPSPARRPGQKPLQRTLTGDRVSSNRTSTSEMPPPPRPIDPRVNYQPPQASPNSGSDKFVKADWEKKLQDGSFMFPPPPPNPPMKPRVAPQSVNVDGSANKQQAGVSRGNMPSAAGTKQKPYIVRDHQPKVTDAAQDEGDEMDIDSSPLQTGTSMENKDNQAQMGKEPRLYSVPLSNWRQQHELQQQQSKIGHQSSDHNQFMPASVDSNLNTKLDDISHVEPFNNGAKGLHSFADLNSSLPFESKASTTVPTASLNAKKLETPPVPKAPNVPLKLTKSSWHGYCVDFGIYLQAFHAFNKTMLTHFDARERTFQMQMQAGMGWLEATGDTSGKSTEFSGFGSYSKGVSEDEHVREVWNMGCERHAEAINEFNKHRERIRYLVNNNIFSDR